jgi:Flp pilus assembly protein TadG
MSNLRSANRLTTRLFQSLKDRKSDIATNPLLRHFASNDRANVAVIFAIVMLPTIYLLGMTMDYTQAYHKQSQLNAAVDAAVIAAVTPSMMSQSNTTATNTATMVFNATAKQLTGLSATPTPTVNVTNNGLVRSVMPATKPIHQVIIWAIPAAKIIMRWHAILTLPCASTC